MGTGLSLGLLGLAPDGRPASEERTAPSPFRISLDLPKKIESATPPELRTIEVAPAAAQAIREQMAKRASNGPKTGLRVGVRAGGCSGLSYLIAFEDDPREDDIVIEADGVKVYCDPKSMKFLGGTKLDFKRTLMKTGFEFVNPHQKSACGCGESFTV